MEDLDTPKVRMTLRVVVWAALTALLVVFCLVYFDDGSSHSAVAGGELAPGQDVVIEQGIRGETPEEKSVADRAEQKSDIRVTPGHWVFRAADDTGTNELSANLVLGKDLQFRIEITAKQAGTVVTHKAAAGTWSVKGATLVFVVRAGDLDIFPVGGRVPVTQASPKLMKIWTDGEQHPFVRVEDAPPA